MLGSVVQVHLSLPRKSRLSSISPGVLILIYVVGILMNISNDLIWQYTLISAFGPYVAIRIFEFFRLGDLSNPFEVDSMKLLLLVLISALINTILKILSFLISFS